MMKWTCKMSFFFFLEKLITNVQRRAFSKWGRNMIFFLLLWRFTAKLNQIYEAEHWLQIYQFYSKDLNGCGPVQHLASSIRHCKLQIPMQYL